MSFFPRDKEIPRGIQINEFIIRQLRASDNEIDYKAAIESGFRSKNFPKEENLKQIERHERDHNNRKSFAYTIVNSNETECYGCIFIQPIVPFLKAVFFQDHIFKDWDVGEDDPAVGFWITPKGWQQGLYIRLLEKLPQWFKTEWPYSHFFLFAIRPSEEELVVINNFNLKQRLWFQLDNQKYVLWQFY